MLVKVSNLYSINTLKTIETVPEKLYKNVYYRTVQSVQPNCYNTKLSHTKYN